MTDLIHIIRQVDQQGRLVEVQVVIEGRRMLLVSPARMAHLVKIEAGYQDLVNSIVRSPAPPVMPPVVTGNGRYARGYTPQPGWATWEKIKAFFRQPQRPTRRPPTAA